MNVRKSNASASDTSLLKATMRNRRNSAMRFLRSCRTTAKARSIRSDARMNERPQVERERERYLTLKGDYAESSKLGYAVLEKLPNDREGAVYLAYDLYYLGHYDEALALANKYDSVLANDKDLPLIEGYVHAHDGHLQEALNDFTRALEIDPNMAPGFEARGYVLNDLREPTKAVADFRTALRLQPNYGEAHLGFAYADLQLHRP